MSLLPLSLNENLWRSSRLAVSTDSRIAFLLRDAAIYLAIGFATALCVYSLNFSLRIPGHAILRSVLPVTLGMSMAPRRMSGTVIGLSALIASWLLRLFGVEGVGVGAFTSMLIIGPLLDVALWKTRSGWPVFLQCALAGMVANLIAFGIRGGSKKMGFDSITMRPFADWWSAALVSYVVCGLLAGFLAAILCFRWHSGPAISQRSYSNQG